MRDSRIRYERNEPLGLEPVFERLASSRTFSPAVWTDAYLAAFALAGGHRMVTFDRGFREFTGVDVELLA